MVDTRPISPTSTRVSRAVRIAILSPGVLIFISAVRLLIIANYDPTTASAIASSTGVVSTLLGTLIPIVPSLLPLLVLIFAVFRRWLLLLFAAIGAALASPAYATLKEAWLATRNQFTAVGHTLSIKNANLRGRLLEQSWVHDRGYILFGALAVVAIVIDNRQRLLAFYPTKKSRPRYNLFDKIFIGSGITVILLLCAVLVCIFYAAAFFFVTTIYHVPTTTDKISPVASQPWLPSEKDTLKSGKTIVGYTLSATDVWYVFLQERNRTIDYFHPDEIVKRELCQLPESQRINQPPLIKLINAPAPTVPSCLKSHENALTQS
jgi:hypothetical protein